MRFGVRNFGVGNNRDTYAKQESNSILITANNIGILSMSYVGRHKLESKEFIQKDDWNKMYLAVDTYENLIDKGWIKDSGWVSGKVVVLYNHHEEDTYDVFLVDIKFE